jgi:RNA polymerase sigma-B factor
MTMPSEEYQLLKTLREDERPEARDDALRELMTRHRHVVEGGLKRVLPEHTRRPRLLALCALVLRSVAESFSVEEAGDLGSALRSGTRKELERVLFAQAQSADSPEDSRAAQAELVHLYERLALSLARRFSDRGEPAEDLEQVARLGLLRALQRFDPDRGFRFATFATQTVVGELKKHFRDRGWGIHVPRSLQEINLAARRAADALTQKLGRSPTVDEIAGTIGHTPEATLEALELGQQAYELLSLDETTSDDDEGAAIGDFIATDADAVADFRDLAEAETILDGLPHRLRQIVRWRHLEGLSQTEIAGRLGISQMHVSRLYRRAIGIIHASLDEDESGGRGA